MKTMEALEQMDDAVGRDRRLEQVQRTFEPFVRGARRLAQAKMQRLRRRRKRCLLLQTIFSPGCVILRNGSKRDVVHSGCSALPPFHCGSSIDSNACLRRWLQPARINWK